MATYQMLIDRVKTTSGFTPQTCWIAHVKSDYGLTRGASSNRRDSIARVKECPPERRDAIVDAIRYFGMLPPNS